MTVAIYVSSTYPQEPQSEVAEATLIHSVIEHLALTTLWDWDAGTTKLRGRGQAERGFDSSCCIQLVKEAIHV